MRTGIYFLACLLLAAVAAVGVLRVGRAPAQEQMRAVEKAGAREAAERPLVLAGHVVTYSLAAALAEGTAVEVAWAWPKGAVWADQWEVAVSPRAAETVAVITLRQSAPEDALYAAVRAVNLAVFEIDATVGADQRTAVVRAPASGSSSSGIAGGPGGQVPVAPLSLGNATRMAEVIGRDLGRLSPGDAGRVTENLRRVKERLFRMKTQAEAKLAAAESLDVVLATPEFAGLAEELGLAVRPAGDAEAGVVLASRVLSDAEARGLAGATAVVVVLDPLVGEPVDAEHYFRVMERNLAMVAAAFAAPKKFQPSETQ